MDLQTISNVSTRSATVSHAGKANATNASPASAAADSPATPAVSSPGLFDRLSLNFTKESLARDTANFAASLRQKLAAHGIKLSDAAALTLDEQGKIRVSNTHPDKDKIEAVLAGDRELQQQFAAISAQSSLVRAAEAPQVFAADYARAGNNPSAFAAVVSRERAYSQARFNLSVSADEHAVVFSMDTQA